MAKKKSTGKKKSASKKKSAASNLTEEEKLVLLEQEALKGADEKSKKIEFAQKFLKVHGAGWMLNCSWC